MKWELNEQMWLQKDEVRHLRKALKTLARSNRPGDNTMRVSIEILLGAGLRNSELCNLLIENIFITGKRSTIRVFEGKGDKTESVTISSNLKAIIHNHIKRRGVNHGPLILSSHNNPFTRQGMGKLVKRALKLAELPEALSVHSMRHTFITAFYISSGYNLIATSQQARHSSITTTQIYAHAVNPDITKAMEGMYK